LNNETSRRERISSKYLVNNKGQKIYIRRWFTPDRPDAIVLFQHGYGEHSGKYEHMAHLFNSRGMAMVSYDFEGHGRSPGLRGDIKDIDAAAEELKMAGVELNRQYPDIPVLVGGHSIGGLIAGVAAARYTEEFAGLLMTAPLLGFASNIPGVVQETARYVTSMAATFPILSLNFEELGQKSIIKEFEKDDLVHLGKIRARLISQVHEYGSKLAKQLKAGLPIPFWLGHGDGDAFADHRISSEIMDENIDENSTVNIYPDRLHFLLQGDNWQNICQDMLEWTNSHVIESYKVDSIK